MKKQQIAKARFKLIERLKKNTRKSTKDETGVRALLRTRDLLTVIFHGKMTGARQKEVAICKQIEIRDIRRIERGIQS